jgi:hypothetical protein
VYLLEVIAQANAGMGFWIETTTVSSHILSVH